ncbi:MAG: sugar ABC transporter permease [Atribacterota bacterium]|nr:sugar ABC transporter permease [Atribacterota bacterium]
MFIVIIKRFFNKKSSMNILYIPALILFGVFIFYPLFSGIRLSFTNWDGYHQAKDFVGGQNYLRLLMDKYFLGSLRNTLIYGFGCTFFQQILGLMLALILNSKLKGKNIARAIIYLPILISQIIMGCMYYLLIEYSHGALNDIMILFGGERIAWLSSANIAIGIIVFINTFQFMGISMILYLAGLQSIPEMYYEAASIDGAKRWDLFKGITFPLLYPAMITSVTINLIGGLKLFDIIRVMTNGGPGYSTNSISTFIDLTYFDSQSAGYASAMGVLLFTMILVVTLILNMMLKGREVNY